MEEKEINSKKTGNEPLENKVGVGGIGAGGGDVLGNAIFGGMLLGSAFVYVSYSVGKMLLENLPPFYQLYSGFFEGIEAVNKCF